MASSGAKEHMDDEAVVTVATGTAGTDSNQGAPPDAAALGATPEVATQNSASYADWDANEIAAAIVQAELDGDVHSVSELSSLLKARRAEDSSLGQDSADAGPLMEECVEVPEEAVGFVIGHGGASIHKLSADSGARLTITRPEAGERLAHRICTIRGTVSEVAKAKQLVQGAVAASKAVAACGPKGRGKGKVGKRGGKEHDLVGDGAGGRAGFAGGICKWYAAGFCRNPEITAGCCRNGLHDSEAAQRAEADWLGQGTHDGSTRSVDPTHGRPLLLLLDLEGGGNRDGRDGEDEIIEIPVLSMCPVSGRELGRFHRFVRPGYWDREAALMHQRFAPACFNTTSSAVSFPEAVSAMCSWICSLLKIPAPDALTPAQFLFVTCGDWDVKTALPRQCSKPMPGTVSPALQQLLFSRWCNLKVVFRKHYRLPPEEAPTGMRGMLRRLRMPLVGQHHLGMDDVSNLAKVLYRVIAEGCRLGPTGHAGPSPAHGHPCGRGKGMGIGKGKGKGKGKGHTKSKPSSATSLPWAPAVHSSTSTTTPVVQAVPSMDAGSVATAATESSPTAGSLDDFLHGAPLPGGAWHLGAVYGSGDEDEGDEDERGDTGGGDEDSTGDNTRTKGRHLPLPEPQAPSAEDRKRPLGPAGFLAGVLQSSPPRSKGADSAQLGPAKKLKVSTLLAGLPEPTTRRSVNPLKAPTEASTISALLERLPAPKAGAAD